MGQKSIAQGNALGRLKWSIRPAGAKASLHISDETKYFYATMVNNNNDNMAKEVSFIIKINDNGSAKRVTADAEELGGRICGYRCL